MRLTMGCVVIVLGIGAALVRAQVPDSRLTIADVEKISGLKSVTQVAKASTPGAGGNLNFVGPEGKLLLMVNFGSAALYDGAKKALMAKKGAKAFSLATFFVARSRPMQPRLTMDQLKAAAKIILSRL